MSDGMAVGALAELIERARAAGVELWVEGRRLRFRAPPGALSPELRESMREQREELVALLRAEAERRTERGPIAANQRGLWFLHQLAPENAAYNVGFAARIHGSLDPAPLEEAIQILVDRHESLRTSIEIVEEQPVRTIAGSVTVGMEQVDASAWSADELRAEIQRSVALPFRLERAPMLRASLYREAPDRHVLLLAAHHVAVDGTSMFLLADELIDLFAALSSGTAVPPRAEAASYSDFVNWQAPAVERATEPRAYWADVLTPPPPMLELPLDRPRAPTPSMRGDAVWRTLEPGLVARLREIGRAEGVTDFVLMLSLWYTFLHRITGQSDLTVVTPVLGRPSARFDRTVGHFVNILPLRMRTLDGVSFRELLRAVRPMVLEGMARQDIPLPTMMEQRKGREAPTLTPFQSLFALQDFSRFERIEPLVAMDQHREVPLGSLALSQYPIRTLEGQFDLSLDVWPHNGEMLCGWKFDRDLLDAATVERWTECFATLASGVADRPEAQLEELPVVSATDRALLARWNATSVRYPDADATLPDLIAAQAARTPAAIAVRSPESGVAPELTFTELDRRSNALAVRLQALGVGRDVPVAVSMERSAELVVALLAVLKAGGAYVPVDPGYPAERQTFMLADCAAPVVLTQQALAAALNVPAGTKVESVDAIWADLGRDGGRLPEARATSDSLAYIIYTSGSTGRPKGAMIEHRAIVNRLLWMQEHFRLTPEDIVLQKTPYSFDVSVWEFFWPLLIGARLVMARPEGHMDPAYLAELIAHERVTTLHFVPSMLTMFLERVAGMAATPDIRRGTMRRVVCSGEALGPAVRDRCFEVLGDVELTNLYGPTEAAVDVSWWRCSRGDSPHSVPIGWPVANTQLHVLNETLGLLPVGVPGELYIGGVQVGRGYWNRPELTAERFIADPFVTGGRLYRTGDRARVLGNGAIEFLGRLDFQVKVRGFRIELGEIEVALRSCPGVGDAAVVAWEDRLVAYLVPSAEGLPPAGELRRRLADTLPHHMLPSVFVPMTEFPLSPSGKLDRKRLPEPKTTRAAARRRRPPQSGAELLVAEVWMRLLGVDEVHLDDNFFELGGHSLLAMQVVATLEERTGKRLDPRALFFKNLGDLAAMIPAVEVTSA